MSKAQTDIRTTSYDAAAARPFGYQGTIDEVIAQIRAEPDPGIPKMTGRTELRHYLGVPPKHLSVSSGPSVEMDENPRYGAPESDAYQPLKVRLLALDDRQEDVYRAARMGGNTIEVSLAYAEHYPYPHPAVRA